MNLNIIKQIDPKEWYRISTIIENEWIVNTVGNSNKNHIHRLIKLGRLSAKNFGIGTKAPLYMIRGQEVIDYLRKTYD